MSKLTIAVSGLNATDNPGPGVPVVRSLRESIYKDSRIIGLCYGSLEPGAYMTDIVDASYQMPYPSEGEDSLLKRLAYIHDKEHIDVIIPNFDAELYPYIKLRSRLQSLFGIRMTLPSEQQFEMRQKGKLAEFGRQSGLKVPHCINCNTLEDFFTKEADFQYPVVVKGSFYEAKIAYSRDQFVTAFHSISAKWGFPIIVQQFVAGTEFNVIGSGDGNGNLLSEVSMRKLFITDKGKAWAGVTVADEELHRQAILFVKATQWQGAFELEMMKDSDDNYHLLEVNPRMPAWVYLATAVGQNIPEQLVSMALEKSVTPYQKYEVGKLFIRCSWDMIVDYETYGSFSVKGEIG